MAGYAPTCDKRVQCPASIGTLGFRSGPLLRWRAVLLWQACGGKRLTHRFGRRRAQRVLRQHPAQPRDGAPDAGILRLGSAVFYGYEPAIALLPQVGEHAD